MMLLIKQECNVQYRINAQMPNQPLYKGLEEKRNKRLKESPWFSGQVFWYNRFVNRQRLLLLSETEATTLVLLGLGRLAGKVIQKIIYHEIFDFLMKIQCYYSHIPMHFSSFSWVVSILWWILRYVNFGCHFLGQSLLLNTIILNND